MAKSNQPRPPTDLDPEARQEWRRVCGELKDAGRLDRADRAILVLYVKTWSIHHKAMQHVFKHGAIVKWPNGITGPSPYYKAGLETGKQLRGLLNDMGLTHASRPTTPSGEAGELKF